MSDDLNDKSDQLKSEVNDLNQSVIKDSSANLTTPSLLHDSPTKENSFKLSKMSFDIKDENTHENDHIEVHQNVLNKNYDDMYEFKDYLVQDHSPNDIIYDQGDLLNANDKYYLSYEVSSPDLFNFEDYFTV